MKNFERKLPPQPIQDVAYQFEIGINKLERAYSFNQAIENTSNLDQGNDSNNVRERNIKIFGNSQEISRIDGDHESFQNLSDQVTDPLSSIKRQTLYDESVQKSNYQVQNKIKSVVSDFQIHQTDLFELIKRNLQSINILSFSQNLYSARQFVYEKQQNQSSFESKILISLEAQKHLINEIQSNNKIFINNHDTNQFKVFFSSSKNAGKSSKSKQFYFKEINQEIQHYVYDIKLQTLFPKKNEPKPSKIPIIDPNIDKQKKRLLEEQEQKEVKIIKHQDQPIHQKSIVQKFNLDFTTLFQQVDESIIQQYNNNVQTPFNMQNQTLLTNPNIFYNLPNSNPFSNTLNNNQQGFVQTNVNTMNNSLPFTKNSSDQNKSKLYNTRSGRS